jgi:hypothetical protein
MVMGVGPAVVAGGSVAVGQLDGETATDQRLEALVDRGQRDDRNLRTHRDEDLVGGGMGIRGEQVPENGGALAREPLAVRVERFAENLLGPECGCRAMELPNATGGEDGDCSWKKVRRRNDVSTRDEGPEPPG